MATIPKMFLFVKFFVATIAAMAAVASAAAPPPYAPAPYKEGPVAYKYAYAVNDEYANLRFDANEARDGYATNGGYSVLLPDGRTQIVKYVVADDYSGYVADVQYEGYAKAPAPYKPAPYKPAPYKPVY